MIILTKNSMKVIDKDLSRLIRIHGIDNIPDAETVINSYFDIQKYDEKGFGTGKDRLKNSIRYKIHGSVLDFYDTENEGHINNIRFPFETEADERIKLFVKSRFNEIEKHKQVKSDKPFGNVLFGTQRGLFEPNTDKEEELYKNIHGYIANNYKIDVEAKNEILWLIKNDEYKDILTPASPGQTIYRGMSAASTDLERFLSPEEIDLIHVNKDKKQRKTLTKPVVYVPNHSISSWTKDKKMANNFALDNVKLSERKIFCLVLICKISELDATNFFDLENFYNELSGYATEQEVIALDKVVINEIEYGWPIR